MRIATDIGKKGKRDYDFRSLRFKLTAAFVAFAALLLGLLWILQTVSLESYYQLSMQGKAGAAVKLLSTYYANSETLDAGTFYGYITDISRKNDVFFYIESEDSEAAISSSELVSGSRSFSDVSRLISDARVMIDSGDSSTVSFTQDNGTAGKILVQAARVESRYRDPVYMYAIVPLSPMGATVRILASQLFWVTLAALILGGLFALYYSRRVARPVKDMEVQARALALGAENVHFEAGGYTELESLASVLNETAAELAKSESLQRDLLANVSHDLRTPLTMIKSYAEMIRDISGDDKERRDEHLGVIIEETDRLSNLVNDILLLSKMQSGTLEMQKLPVDIQKAAESVLSVYKVLEDQDGFRFEVVEIEGARPFVRGDEAKLQQVFSNLISNAVQYSEDDRRIVIRFEDMGHERVRCSVRDHGVGIAPEDLQNIWNRYQRASKQGTRAHKSGTGLGLSIAREILERHNAEYGVESVVGKGSCFWFVLDCKYVVDTQ